MGLDRFSEILGAKLAGKSAVAPDHQVAEVKASGLADACVWLKDHCAAFLLDAFALEDYSQPGNYRVYYTFDLNAGRGGFVTLWARVDGQKPVYPAVSPHIHAADWFEREIFELFGVRPAGHPMLGGFIFREGSGQGLFPLRKNRPNENTASLPENRSAAKTSAGMVEGEGVFEMPLGPVYSGVAEAVHFTLSSIGEETLWVSPRLFYKHRGFEKAAENLPPEQVVLLAERISGATGVAESLAFCQAVESLAGLEIPERALYLRTVFAELERIYNHVGSIADLCESTSLAVGTAQGYILKEKLLRLNARLTGHRYLMGVNCPGGVRVDLDQEKIGLLRKTLKEAGRDFQAWLKMLLATDSFLDRLEGIGVVAPATAGDLSATGPVGRASGMDRDFRRDHPYAAYSRVQFAVPVCAEGDCLARMKVRQAEVEQSLAIVEQLLPELPAGALANNSRPELPAGGSACGYSEGPRGGTLHWVFTGEDGLLRRWRVRPPSLVNWHAYPVGTEGCAFQDFPIILASFGLSPAECDR
ncbi:MAG: NADH-quinone oxidoreductase subunit C [Bacillota bacterium]